MQSRIATSSTLFRRWLVQHKRSNFTASTPLTERIPDRKHVKDDSVNSEKLKRMANIEKHLTGKPFDNLEDFTIPARPEEKFAETIESINLDIVPSPFVHFDEYATLNILLHDETRIREMSKYDFFIRGKWDTVSNFDDKMDCILNWNNKYNQSYKSIKKITDKANLKFPEDVKASMINTLDDEINFDFKTALDNLTQHFPKYSFENLAVLYVKVIPELSSEKQELFIYKMNEFFPQNVLHFHDQTLELIARDLLAFKQVKSVNTIARAYNEFSHSESDFLNVVSKQFCELYMSGLVEAGDVQMARNVLKGILKAGYVPDVEIITGYFKLVSTACLNANAPKDKKEMLFNLFTKPLKSVILKEGMINETIVASICKFMRLAMLPEFISYLKLNPDYSKLVEIPDMIIDRLIVSETFKTQPEKTKIVTLTTILQVLDVESKQLSSTTIKKIIDLYASTHSPLAVLKWSKSLNEPLNETEKTAILDTLQSGNDSLTSRFDLSNKL